MRAPTEPARIGILLYDGTEPIDLGGTLGVLSMASRRLPGLTTAVIAPAAGPVTLAGGLVVQAPFGPDTAPDCDRVIVCGGPGWPQAAADPAIRAYLAALPPDRLASVCTGALILAAAGVLDGRTATTRRTAIPPEPRSPLDRLAGHAARALPRVVVDDTIVTGGGVALAIDATLYLLGRLYGDQAREDVARLIEYDRAYAANTVALGIERPM